MRKLTTTTFNEKAKIKHSDIYSYPDEYVASFDKLTIVCSIHGNFQMRPAHHLQGRGCPHCGRERVGRNRLTQAEFLQRANAKHGVGTYDYSQTEYQGYDATLVIICPNHGSFIQTATSHLTGHGCRNCADARKRNKQKMSTSEFVDNANDVHGTGTYDYGHVHYVNNATAIIIICPIHGSFTKTPLNHIQGKQGCPKC